MSELEPTALSFSQRLLVIKQQLQQFSATEAIRFFAVEKHDRLLKSTVSLCPVCLAHVPALVYTRDGRVWMQKKCLDHGNSTALVENDEQFYKLSNKDQWGIRYSQE